MPDSLVTEKTGGGAFLNKLKSNEKYIAVAAVVVLLIVAIVILKKDGFASPDGVVSRRSQRQKRSDTNVDRTWNLKEFEKSVALINRKASA